jgi:1-deoxy-D-xylulose-5-phosphate synthase
MELNLLDKLDLPKDVKTATNEDLKVLAADIRNIIIEKTSEFGGHVAPNLGIVELCIALHKVFDSPNDKFIFDVSHQCYTHKLLTGRLDLFEKWGQPGVGAMSGFTAPYESDHDQFIVGHTSTSISLGAGLAFTEKLEGTNNKVISIIGDGSLSGGEALEGLSISADQGNNHLIVVNDNEMSMDVNHGGIYKNLAELRNTNGESSNNLFKTFGLNYLYEPNGNDIQSCINALEIAKGFTTPTVLHIHTTKGFGYTPSQSDQRGFHFRPPYKKETGEILATTTGKSYPELTSDFFKGKIDKGEQVYAISAGAPAIGYSFKGKFDDNYIDVGIAEQSATSFAAGLAKSGKVKPYVCIGANFIRRAVDQIVEDITENDLPVKLVISFTGIDKNGSMTHQSHLTIPILSNIPGLTVLTAKNQDEYLAMLEFMHTYDKPIAILHSLTKFFSETTVQNLGAPIEFGKSEILKTGKDVAVIAVGEMIGLAKDTVNELSNQGITATLVNARFVTPIDTELLQQLKSDHNKVITIENGSLEGGFGAKVAQFYSNSDIKVYNFGAAKEHINYLTAEEIISKYNLAPSAIINSIL